MQSCFEILGTRESLPKVSLRAVSDVCNEMLPEVFPMVRTFTSVSLLDSSVSAKGLNPQSDLKKMPGNET